MAKLPPYTLAPHNAERYTLVVTYTSREGIDEHEKGQWGEGWPVAAWTDSGEPLVMDHGLLTVDALLERYKKDSDEVGGMCSRPVPGLRVSSSTFDAATTRPVGAARPR